MRVCVGVDAGMGVFVLVLAWVCVCESAGVDVCL